MSVAAPRSPLGNILHIFNPQVKKEKQVRKGAVAIDVKIIRNGRQVAAFTCEGKFESQAATSGMSILGSGGGQAEFAASTLGQATRAAANDCLRQAAEAFKTNPGK